MRDDFSAKTKNTLQKRANLHCSNPDCQIHTSGWHTDDEKATNVGVAAHITAASEGGPRYDPNLTSKERKSAKNGIWLCAKCAMCIDSDIESFPVGLLLKWKELAEKGQQVVEEHQQINETLVHGYSCGHCSYFIEDGLLACRGCGATVIYGQAQMEKRTTFQVGAGSGVLFALYILLVLPKQLNEMILWVIPQYFGLDIYWGIMLLALFAFIGGFIACHIAERIRRSEPPRFFRF